MKFRLTETLRRSAAALTLVPLSLLIRSVARAADAGGFAAPLAAQGASAPGISRVALSLLLVLALLLGGAWLMKRLSGLARGSSPRLRVLANLALAARERAVLIEVDGRVVLLGVAPGNVRTLLVGEPPGGIGAMRPGPGGADADRAAETIAAEHGGGAAASGGTASAGADFKSIFRDMLRRSVGR